MVLEAAPDRLLFWPRVHDRIGLSRTTVWRLRRTGDFPDPVPLSPGRVAWRERDITAWSESRDGAVFATGPRRSPFAAAPAAAAQRPQLKRRPPELLTQPPAPPDAPPPETPGPPPSPAPEAPAKPTRRARPPAASNQLGFDF